MAERRSRLLSLRLNWPVALSLLPAILLGILIVKYWVNVPLLDEWWTPALLFKEYFVDGHLSWHSLIAQHNESRKLFPRLIFLGCARLFGWDTRVPMALSWISCVVVWSNLVHLQRQTLALTFRARAFLLFFFGALLFSTNQWENWLWGIQLIVFIPPLCLTSCLLIHRSALGYGSKVVLCAALSFVAEFSYANGMLCWFLAFPYTVKPKKKELPWIGLYLVLATGSILLYFWDYSTPANSPSGKFALEHPLSALHYLCAWIGSSFARGNAAIDQISQATFFGGLALVAVGWVFYSVFRQRRTLLGGDGFSRVEPWMILLLYGLISGVTTSVGRLAFGIDQALASRYIGFSCYVLIGLGGLLGAVEGQKIKEWLERSPPRYWLAGVVTGLIFACFLFDWMIGFRGFRSHRITEEDMALTLRFLPLIPDNPQLPLIYPDVDRVRQVALPLFERNVLRQEVGPWLLKKVAHPDGEGGGDVGVARGVDRIQIFGWAMLPDKKIVPDCVVVASTDAGGALRLVTAFIPRLLREDIGAQSGRKALLYCGFNLPVTFIPAPNSILSAYAVDLKRQRVFRLRGPHS